MKKYLIILFSLFLVSCGEDDYDLSKEAADLQLARERLIGPYYLSYWRSWETPQEAEEYGYERCESRFIELHEDRIFKYGNYLENCEKEYLQEAGDSWDVLEDISFNAFIIELRTSGKTEQYSVERTNKGYFLKKTAQAEPQWREGFTGYWSKMWLTPL